MLCKTCQRELPETWFYFKRRYRRRTKDVVKDYYLTCKSCMALRGHMADARVKQKVFPPPEAFRPIYDEWCLRKIAGEDVHMDHILPLTNELVCGLHVPDNLRVIKAWMNISKGNLMTSTVSDSLG